MSICYQLVITSPTNSEITFFFHSFVLHVINGTSYKLTGSLEGFQVTVHKLTRDSANKSHNNKASNVSGTSKNAISYAISTLLQMVTLV